MSEFMHHLPDQELERIIREADGKYTEGRLLALQEVQRRAAIIALIRTVDMPVADPADYLEEDYVHNHGPAEGRGLDCGEALVDGKLKGWCLRPPQPEEGPDYHANLAQWNTHNYIVPVDPMDMLNDNTDCCQ
jgi:hypothetical protein